MAVSAVRLKSSKRKNTQSKKSASPFDVFLLLQDGEWHASSELKDRFGIHGDKRARELRMVEYGSFDVESCRPADLQRLIDDGSLPVSTAYYRIRREQLLVKQYEASCLRQRIKPSTQDPYSRTRSLRLTQRDMLWLFLAVTQPGYCDQAPVSNAWARRRDHVIAKLAELVPDEMKLPTFCME